MLSKITKTSYFERKKCSLTFLTNSFFVCHYFDTFTANKLAKSCFKKVQKYHSLYFGKNISMMNIKEEKSFAVIIHNILNKFCIVKL